MRDFNEQTATEAVLGRLSECDNPRLGLANPYYAARHDFVLVRSE